MPVLSLRERISAVVEQALEINDASHRRVTDSQLALTASLARLRVITPMAAKGLPRRPAG